MATMLYFIWNMLVGFIGCVDQESTRDVAVCAAVSPNLYSTGSLLLT